MCSELNASRSDYTRTCFDNARRKRLPRAGRIHSAGSFRSYRFESCVACEGDARIDRRVRTPVSKEKWLADEKSVAYDIA